MDLGHEYNELTSLRVIMKRWVWGKRPGNLQEWHIRHGMCESKTASFGDTMQDLYNELESSRKIISNQLIIFLPMELTKNSNRLPLNFKKLPCVTKDF